MSAYIFATVDIHDSAIYDEYRKGTLASIEKFGGRFLVRGGETQLLEGDLHVGRVLVVEFPSMEVARTWYSSPEYQSLAEIRRRGSKTDVILLDGVPA